MSATANAKGPSNPSLRWYEAKVTLNKGGTDKVYHCNFLCSTDTEAQLRSVSMAQAEGAKFVSSEVRLSAKYNTGVEPPPPETLKAAGPQPAPQEKHVPELSPKEKRAMLAFVVVKTEVPATCYVLGEEDT